MDEINKLINHETKTLDALIEKEMKAYAMMNYIGIGISSSMLFYVLTKYIFNIFADIKLPYDKWSWIDIYCAFSNIIGLLLMT